MCEPGSNNCFVEGTQVLLGVQEECNSTALNLSMEDKNGALALATQPSRYLTQNIERLRPGDLLLCRDQFDADGPLVLQRIEEVFVRTTYHLQIVTSRSSNGQEQTIQTTNEHPIYVEDKGWVDSRELKVGDQVPEAGGEYATVTATRYELHNEGVRVYNFRVQEAHTYFVREAGSNAEPMWVHNTYGGPKGFADADFGTDVHQGFQDALVEQTGTLPEDWEMRTKPGLTGVDAEYVGPRSTNPGFKYAELKPYSDNGFSVFQKQLDNWNLPPGKTQLWFYNKNGIIGASGLNY
jgi:hypothetical protein